MEKALQEAARLLAEARRVLVLTGAGVSAESGIPTFRDAQQGLWATFDPMQLASPEGFARDPKLVWEWYAARLEQVEKALPNAGHQALAELERRKEAFLLLTQNVDGLHQRAGNQNVHEIHGSIRRVRCTVTDHVYAEGEIPVRPPFPLLTPQGHLGRPDVVWFGEVIRMDACAAVERFLAAGRPDVLLVVGTTGMFPYIQRWVMQAFGLGTKVIEVNPEPSALADFCHVELAGKAGEVLPGIVSPP
ncbi:MAG: NAD-dependent deacetylase [Candidatus Sumerlaeota bacterium]|nr:NAD-dependent deacetylase [Candidatus Sumerlaeota bacterium]